jgi:threonine aldolase
MTAPAPDGLNFLSDNAGGVAPAVMSAIAEAQGRWAEPYFGDGPSRRCDAAFARLFGTDVLAVPVLTGTAANALGLASVTPPGGAVFCHEAAHVYTDEAGAPEFFTHGAKLLPLAGELGKVAAETLRAALDQYASTTVHQAAPAALSITQPTEWGVCYTPAEVAALCRIAKRSGLSVHMDGARFGNAVAYLGCGPDEITWRVGVDVLSFGATKNGAMAAEAVVVFALEKSGNLFSMRKRSGHLVSKSRYVSIQLEAMLDRDYWLELSSHANAMARAVARGLVRTEGVELAAPVEANLVFVRMPSVESVEALRKLGVAYQIRVRGRQPILRFACSFSTTTTEVARLLRAVDEATSAAVCNRKAGPSE